MATFAYLRVSTDRQDLDNQRHGILEYANSHRLRPIKFVDDARDLNSQTQVQLKRLIELVRKAGDSLYLVLAGHPKRKNDMGTGAYRGDPQAASGEGDSGMTSDASQGTMSHVRS